MFYSDKITLNTNKIAIMLSVSKDLQKYEENPKMPNTP